MFLSSMFERNERKSTFDKIATDYDAIRPRYPDVLIERVIAYSELSDRASLLEIGCGTGQATRSFVGRGYHLTSLDISSSLIAIAKRNFASNPNIQFHQIGFEEYEGKECSFDVIFAATAWHWIDPDVGYAKVASLLKPTGSFVILAHLLPKPYTGFFKHAQEVYSKVIPQWRSPETTMTTTDQIRTSQGEMERSGLFSEVEVYEHSWSQEYTRDQYLQLLNTYSDNQRLEEGKRKQLFEGLGRLIDEEYHGKIVRPYLSVAYIGKKT